MPVLDVSIMRRNLGRGQGVGVDRGAGWSDYEHFIPLGYNQNENNFSFEALN